jgi:dienelactone hydrolase
MSLKQWVCVFALGCGTVSAQDSAHVTPLPNGAHYVEREFRLPVSGSGPKGLDVLEVYVSTPGKHPLALLTHGTSNVASEKMELTPWAYLGQAMWFARRGYVALVIIRRGYGSSGGEQDGTNGGCREGATFEATGEASADDLRNAANYAEHEMPEVDATRIVSAGVSTGGFAQVALTAHPPAGLLAAISFAGGRGGDGKGDLCNEAGIVAAYRAFGRKSHTPMLWIYAENDKWFSPNYAHKFEAAFQSGGGHDEFVLAPPDGDDGHHLYAHPAVWSATVDKYIAEHRLPTVSPPYAPPPLPNVEPPQGLGEHGIAAFKVYLAAGPHKAFATNGESYYGYSVGMFSQELADEHAVENCNKVRKGGTACVVRVRGDGK